MTAALTKFACLDCHKVFKRPSNTVKKVCPNCGSQAWRVGSDFKAPPLHDAAGWELAAFLIRRGFPFYRLGVPFPTTMREAERFVVEQADRAVIE